MNESDSSEVAPEWEPISRELDEWLPKQGDKLIHETPSAAWVDPLGYSDPAAPLARSPIGRRDLYSEGYLEAGDRLVEGLTRSPMEDVLIYPILFLYRHHIELELKGRIWYWLNWRSGFDEEAIRCFVKDEKLDKAHGLSKLWDVLKKHWPDCDKEMPKTRPAFEALLSELDSYDPDGQAARYPVDRKGQQTLLRLSSIDLAKLRASIHKISHYLGCIREA